MKMHVVAALAAAGLSLATTAYAANLTGAGGTAIYPVLSKWADQYAKQTGTQINYQAIGSGGGIEQIRNKTVMFANTDMPLKPDVLDKPHPISAGDHLDHARGQSPRHQAR
jgi:phosphate transport system substrate-binding protein